VGIGTSLSNPNMARLEVDAPNSIDLGWGNIYVRTTDGMAADLGGEVSFGGNYLSNGAQPMPAIAPGAYTVWASIAGRKENATSGDPAGYLTLAGQGGTPGLKVGATCVSGTCPSDKNLKEDIHYLSGSLALLEQLKPTSYRYKGESRGPVGYGLIAQDVERVMPGLVSRDGKGFLRVDYSPLTMMLVDAVQQLSRRTGAAVQSEKVECLERENAQLRGRLERVEAALQRLESTR
jgi:hypothetical protein